MGDSVVAFVRQGGVITVGHLCAVAGEEFMGTDHPCRHVAFSSLNEGVENHRSADMVTHIPGESFLRRLDDVEERREGLAPLDGLLAVPFQHRREPLPNVSGFVPMGLHHCRQF